MAHEQVGNSVGVSQVAGNGATATVTTSAASGFVVGQQVSIAGSATGYTGTFTILTTPSSTTFTIKSTGTTTVSPAAGAAFVTDADAGLRGLTADFSNPNQVALYGTTTATSGNRIVSIVDSAPGQSGGLGAYTTLATAAANTAFRGVSFAPVAAGTTASNTSLSLDTNTAIYGSEPTFTATVAANATGAAPTGVVSFRNSANGREFGAAPIQAAQIGSAQTIGTATESGSTVTITTSGSHGFTTGEIVTISGVGTGYNGTFTITVTGTTTFTYTATSTGLTAASGGSAQANSYTAVLSTIGNIAANATAYNVLAVYTGDSTYAASTSASQTLTIGQQTPTVAVTVAPNSVSTSQSYTATATIQVSPTSAPLDLDNPSASPYTTGVQPTGTVTFTDTTTGTTLGTAGVSAAIVSINGIPTVSFTASLPATSTAPFGNHTIQAVYNGDTNFTTANNTASLNVVNASATTVSSDTPTALGTATQTVTYTATVSSTTAGTLDGTVQFYDNLIPIGAAVTINGANTGVTATQTITTALVQAASGNADVLTPGIHSITAQFVPTSGTNYGPSSGVVEQTVTGQAFGTSDTFVERLGDGATPIIGTGALANASAGNTIFVDEYNPGGTLVQSLILPSADGTNSGQTTIKAVVGNGQTSTTGQIALSGDGQYLFLTGYDVNPLTVKTTAQLPVAANTSRSVARISANGTIQTNSLTSVQTGGNIVGVASPDGNQFYVSGHDGVNYFANWTQTGLCVSATQTYSTSFTADGIESAGGNLYVAGYPYAGSTNLVGQFGTLPTAAGAAPSALPGLPSTDNFQQFPIDSYFTHLNGTGAPAGINTMYVTDNGTSFANGRITKWALNSATITSATETGTTVTIAYSGSAVFAVGQTVAISGVGVAGYNGTFTIATVGTGSFTLNNPTSGLAASNGGAASQWRLVDTLTAGSGNTATSFGWLNGKTDSSGNVTIDATYGDGGFTPKLASNLYTISDTNGWNAPLGTGGAHSDAVTTVATIAPASTTPPSQFELFRGVALAPQAQTNVLVDNGPNPSTTTQANSLTVTFASPGSANVPTGTATLIDTNNSNAVLATGTLSNGAYTFNLAAGVLASGTHNLVVSYGGDTYHLAQNSNTVSQVVSAGVAPTVTSVVVNGVKVVDGLGTTENLAGQNSVVANLLVTFNEAVTLDSNAFTLAALPVSGTGNPGTIFVGGGNQPYQGNVAISVHAVTSTGAATSSPSQYYEINFTGAGSDYATDVAIGNSVTTLDGNATAVIRDGVFNLTTAAGAVHANGQTMASSNTNTFWKMYGSVGNANTLSTTAGDGNSEVAINSTDAGVFRTAFGLSEESDGGPFNPALDSNLDGFIDATDASRFRNNFSNDWGF